MFHGLDTAAQALGTDRVGTESAQAQARRRLRPHHVAALTTRPWPGPGPEHAYSSSLGFVGSRLLAWSGVRYTYSLSTSWPRAWVSTTCHFVTQRQCLTVTIKQLKIQEVLTTHAQSSRPDMTHDLGTYRGVLSLAQISLVSI